GFDLWRRRGGGGRNRGLTPGSDPGVRPRRRARHHRLAGREGFRRGGARNSRRGAGARRGRRFRIESIREPSEDRRDPAEGRQPDRHGGDDERMAGLRRQGGSQISICVPSSTTRFGGMLKKSVARVALRDIHAKRWSRHIAMPGASLGITVSRERKNE